MALFINAQTRAAPTANVTLSQADMNDLRDAVRFYASELAGSRADDAWHALLELGPAALPLVSDALRSARQGQVRVRLAEVLAHSRSIEALPFLRELLNERDAEMWKVALDGLVTLGGEPTVRSGALEVLAAAREIAAVDRREWIDEAIEQIPPADGPV